MTRIVYATVVGLCGAIAVHFAIIFGLPVYSDNAPWRAIIANTEIGQPKNIADVALPTAAGGMTSQLDPFMRTLVCRYDVRNGVMHIRAPQSALSWTASIINPQGLSIFSVNDRIAVGRRIDIVVTGQAQERQVRQEPLPAFGNSIIVPTSEPQGFAVIRLFVPDETWEPVADQVVQDMTCRTVAMSF